MTIRAKLLEYREDLGGYITYVFENLEENDPYEKYIMCTRFPNWDTPFPDKYDEGFLQFREVIAGQDSWYDHSSNSYIPYKYTNFHFINFIKDKPISDILI